MEEKRCLGDGRRLDVLLSTGSLSRSQAARLIKEGQARVSGKVVTKPSFLPEIGDEVVLTLPKAVETANKAEDIPLCVVYEDRDLAVVNKESGLVVHPAAGNQSGTLVNALLFHLDQLSGIGGEKRPGIVHRLDKDTSGLMIVAKNDQAHAALSRALAERRIQKHYLAVAAGRFKEEQGEIDLPLGRSQKDRKKMAVVAGGRQALTRYAVVEQQADRALLMLHLVTGRTHQIRVHLSHLHHPVLGDPIYGHKGLPAAPRLMLHAWSLAFSHPITKEPLRFSALPEACFQAPDHEVLARFLRLLTPEE